MTGIVLIPGGNWFVVTEAETDQHTAMYENTIKTLALKETCKNVEEKRQVACRLPCHTAIQTTLSRSSLNKSA